jgi:SAM-dependent methyltransferase
MIRPTEWPIAFFDDDYLRIYRPMLTSEVTQREADFIESTLGLPAGSAVLDLACGFGRHAVAMASRGYKMTGVDFNPRYIELATQAAAEAGVSAQWRVGDMRELDDVARYAGAYSYFTSFGYFSDPENERVIANVARALEPGGRFLLDMMNRDWVLTHPQQRTWTPREDGGMLMEEITLDLPTSRVRSRQILIEPQGGSRVTKEFDLRAYTCAELTALFARHGLAVDRVLGGADGGSAGAGAGATPYSADSRRLILRATRAQG